MTTTLTEATKAVARVILAPKFGDIIENGWASEDNPTRRGFFVREGRRTGRMNPGRYFEVTDGRGKFWEIPVTADHKITAHEAAEKARPDLPVVTVPEGWALVPVEPTDSMEEEAIEAGRNAPLTSWGAFGVMGARAVWSAMLAEDVRPNPPVVTGEALARRFHEIYERLAPSFGYDTRPETRDFDPTTPNGRLMIAVCAEISAAPPPPTLAPVTPVALPGADVLRQALEALEPFESVAAVFMPDGQLPLDTRGVALDIPLGACEQGRTAADLRICTEERLFVRHFRRARAAASAVREAMKHPASEPPADTVKSEADGCEPDPAALRSEDHERQRDGLWWAIRNIVNDVVIAELRGDDATDQIAAALRRSNPNTERPEIKG